jgi:hypothetical protein
MTEAIGQSVVRFARSILECRPGAPFLAFMSLPWTCRAQRAGGGVSSGCRRHISGGTYIDILHGLQVTRVFVSRDAHTFDLSP